MEKDLLSSFKLHPGFSALKEVLVDEHSRLEQQLRQRPSSTDTVDFLFGQGALRGGLDVLEHIFNELEIEKGG